MTVTPAYTDQELLGFYREWSEYRYCASFTDPTPRTVREFREWLHDEDFPPTRELEFYEKQFLAEYDHQQEEVLT